MMMREPTAIKKEDQADETHEEVGNNEDIASVLLMVGGSLKD